MQRQALYFTAPYTVEVRSEPWPAVGPHQVGVRTRLSAISAGTEMLIYRGQFPPDLPTDVTLKTLAGRLAYPLKYGYAAVGEVETVGEGVSDAWVGRAVLAFNPHESSFVADLATVQPVPAGVALEAAALLPNLETAISLVMDGRPVIGERVAVLGLGVIGLLTTYLLARFPLAQLAGVDHHAQRRDLALAWGARQTSAPEAAGPAGEYDLVYEVSGQPEALNLALQLVGYNGRIVVGSWYGQKTAPLNLGGDFHRRHIQISSSQVSTLAPQWRGRWDKERRLGVAWHHLTTLPAAQLITHRWPLKEAAAAYRQLDQRPETCLQMLLTYDR